MRTIFITGVGGLVGSSCAYHFLKNGWRVFGIDNNTRGFLFGEQASVEPVIKALQKETHYTHLPETYYLDHYGSSLKQSDCLLHCAAQPSHALADSDPDMDFNLNVRLTHRFLVLWKKMNPTKPFIYMSTIKVYGDGLNKYLGGGIDSDYQISDWLMYPLEPKGSEDGFTETLPLFDGAHSIFGAHKLMAETLVREYGTYFGVPTISLRAGCITGSRHRGVAQHGFLSHLVKTLKYGGTYTIEGSGWQVRDNLHADDLARAIYKIADATTIIPGSVYNIGGGLGTECSVHGAIKLVSKHLDLPPEWLDLRYAPPRRADHNLWITDSSKFQKDFSWTLTMNLDQILTELIEGLKD